MNLTSWFSISTDSSWTDVVGWTLLHSVWQLTAVAFALQVTHEIWQRTSARASSTVVYTLNCVALVIMFGFVVGTAGLLASQIAESDSTMVSLELESSFTSDLATSDLDWGRLGQEVKENAPSPSPTKGVSGRFEPGLARSFSETEGSGQRNDGLSTPGLSKRLDGLLPWLAWGWIVGVALFAIRLLLGLRVVWRLQTSCQSVLPEATLRSANSLRKRMGISRTIHFAASTLVEVPTVVGCLRPVVLVPISAITGLSGDQIQLIFAHELAHIRRHDFLVNVVQTCLETVLFYHPAVWWVSAQIRDEREHCCDDVAVDLLGNSRAYAQALTRLEESRVPEQLVLSARGGKLLQRVRRLTDPSSHRQRQPSTVWVSGMVALVFLGTMFIVGNSRLLFAQSTAEQVLDNPSIRTSTSGEILPVTSSGRLQISPNTDDPSKRRDYVAPPQGLSPRETVNGFLDQLNEGKKMVNGKPQSWGHAWSYTTGDEGWDYRMERLAKEYKIRAAVDLGNGDRTMVLSTADQDGGHGTLASGQPTVAVFDLVKQNGVWLIQKMEPHRRDRAWAIAGWFARGEGVRWNVLAADLVGDYLSSDYPSGQVLTKYRFNADGSYSRVDPATQPVHGVWRLEGDQLIRTIDGKEARNRIIRFFHDGDESGFVIEYGGKNRVGFCRVKSMPSNPAADAASGRQPKTPDRQPVSQLVETKISVSVSANGELSVDGKIVGIQTLNDRVTKWLDRGRNVLVDLWVHPDTPITDLYEIDELIRERDFNFYSYHRVKVNIHRRDGIATDLGKIIAEMNLSKLLPVLNQSGGWQEDLAFESVLRANPQLKFIHRRMDIRAFRQAVDQSGAEIHVRHASPYHVAMFDLGGKVFFVAFENGSLVCLEPYQVGEVSPKVTSDKKEEKSLEDIELDFFLEITADDQFKVDGKSIDERTLRTRVAELLTSYERVCVRVQADERAKYSYLVRAQEVIIGNPDIDGSRIRFLVNVQSQPMASESLQKMLSNINVSKVMEDLANQAGSWPARSLLSQYVTDRYPSLRHLYSEMPLSDFRVLLSSIGEYSTEVKVDRYHLTAWETKGTRFLAVFEDDKLKRVTRQLPEGMKEPAPSEDKALR